MAPEGYIPCMASGEFSAITPIHRCANALPDPPCSSGHKGVEIAQVRQGSKRGSLKKYGVKAVQGARSYMEDTHVAMSKFMSFRCASRSRMSRACAFQPIWLQFYGVFDGHGGAAVAEHCADTLPKRLYNSIRSLMAQQVTEQQLLPTSFTTPSSSTHADFVDVVSQSLNLIIPTAMEISFKDTDDSLREGTVAAWTGTTAIVAVVGAVKIWIANCGDSRAVLCHHGTAVPLSEDHKPSCPAEAERITRAGGVVVHNYGRRVMGVLSVSRAIGDHSFQQYGLTAEPEVRTIDRQTGDEFLLLASDGLWEVMSNTDAIQLARRCFLRAKSRGAGPGAAARISANVLIRVALGRGSGDNITVLVVDLTVDAEQPQGPHGVTADKSSSETLGSEDGSSYGDDVVEGLLRVSGSGAQEGTLRQKDGGKGGKGCEVNGDSEGSNSDSDEGKHATHSSTEAHTGQAQGNASADGVEHEQASTTYHLTPAERSYSNLTLVSDGDSNDGEHRASDTEDVVDVPESAMEAEAGHSVQGSQHTGGVYTIRKPVVSPFADHSWQEGSEFSSQPSSPLTQSQCSPSKPEAQQQDRLFVEADGDLSVTSPFYLHPYSPTGCAPFVTTTIDPPDATMPSLAKDASPTKGFNTSISPFSNGPPIISPFETHNSTGSFSWDQYSNASTSPFLLPPGAESPFEVGPCPDLSDDAIYGDLSYKPAQCSGSDCSSRTMVASGEQPSEPSQMLNTISQTPNVGPAPTSIVVDGGATAPLGNPFKEASRISEPLPGCATGLPDSDSLGSLTSAVSIVHRAPIETTSRVAGKRLAPTFKARISPFANTQRARARSCNSIELPSPFSLEQEARSTQLRQKAASLPVPTADLTQEEASQVEAGLRLFRSIRLDHIHKDTCSAARVSGQGTAAKDAPASKESGLGACPLSTKSLADIPECLSEENREFSLGQWLGAGESGQKMRCGGLETNTGRDSQTPINAISTLNIHKKHDADNNKLSHIQLQRGVFHNVGAGLCNLSVRCSTSDLTTLGRGGGMKLKTNTSVPLEEIDGTGSMAGRMHHGVDGSWQLWRFGSSGLELTTVGV